MTGIGGGAISHVFCHENGRVKMEWWAGTTAIFAAGSRGGFGFHSRHHSHVYFWALHAGKGKCSMWLVNKVEINFSKIGFIA